MVKQKLASRRKSRSEEVWAEQLCAVLAAVDLLVGPPFGTNAAFAKFVRKVIPQIERLGHLSQEEFLEHLARIPVTTNVEPGQSRIDSHQELKLLSLDEVDERIADPSTTRQQLLNLVRVRFEGSTGTLLRLSRDALAERLAALVMNERTHQTLARLASGSSEATTDLPDLRSMSPSDASEGRSKRHRFDSARE